MIALRMLALLAAALVFILPPMLLGEAGDNASILTVAGGFLALIVISISFLYVGLMGDRMYRSGGKTERKVGGLLLVAPMIAGTALLASHQSENVLWSSAALLALSVVLFLSFIFPMIEPGQRPLRKRERQEPNLLTAQG